MTEFTKRDATPEEVETAFANHWQRFNLCNPGFASPESEWRKKLDDAIAEGYKNEVCSCGCVWLAFHHFGNCREAACPFSDGVTLLDRIFGDDKSNGTSE